ncbi:MAG: radical SAM protein [Candidatus Aegiribacteria sp.]|nr:radical SAM protein [Candidatus Aegiribacteria sp.]
MEITIGNSRRRVLLIQSYWAPPGKDSTSDPVYPLGLVYLATAISGKHSVRIIDLCISGSPWDNLSSAIADFSPDVVGISIRNADSFGYSDLLTHEDVSVSYCLNNLTRTLSTIEKAGFHGWIIIGGQTFSMFPERIMAHSSSIDFGVFLEGENTLPELLNNLDNPDSVKGIYLREEGRILFTGNREYTDLAIAGPPDRSLSPADSYSHSPAGIGIQSKRGCILSCSYCIYPYLSGSSLRLREPSVVVDEIEEIGREGIECVHFVDPVFNIPQEHSEDICREILRRNIRIKWIAWFHPRFMNREFISLCEKAGCVKFELSPDAYGQRGLDALQKHITTKEIRNSLKLAKGLTTSMITYNFLINHPGETVVSFLRKLIFCVKIKLTLGNRSKIELLNHIRILPGTEVYKKALSEGRIKTDTDMLPVCEENMKLLFYKRTRSINVLYKFLMLILRLKYALLRGS